MADESGVPVVYLRTLDDSLALRERLTEGAAGRHRRRRLDRARGRRRPPASTAPRSPSLESLDLPLLRVLGPEVAAGLRRPPPRARRRPPHRRPGHRHHLARRRRDGRPRLTAARSTSTCWWSASASSRTPSSPRPPGSSSTTASAPTRGCAPRDQHVHAIGDVANVDHPVLGHPLRVEHWDTAKKHGTALAANRSAARPPRPTHCPTSSPTSTTSAWSTSATPGPRATTGSC